MERYKSLLLLERLFELDRDVDLIYNLAFKQFIDKIQSKKMSLLAYDNFSKFPIQKIIRSDKFISKDSRLAHKINPIEVICGFIFGNQGGSVYKPLKTLSKNYEDFNSYPLYVLLDREILRDFISNNYSWDNLFDKNISLFKVQEYKASISEDNVKERIAHELSHWIDDTKHGRFLLKRAIDIEEIKNNELLLDKEKNLLITKIKKQGEQHPYMIDTEINAIIHSVKILKNKKKNEYDSMTLSDLFANTAIYSLAQDVHNKAGREGYYKWQKQIITRLSREGLLGKNMKNFVVFESVQEYKLNLERLSEY